MTQLAIICNLQYTLITTGEEKGKSGQVAIRGGVIGDAGAWRGKMQ